MFLVNWKLAHFLYLCVSFSIVHIRRKQYQQQLEKGDYSLCSSPTTPDCRDSYDLSRGKKL